MIPKIGRGASFKGLGEYLLHDKGADSSERVAWTETRNLATNRAEAAIGVMAATAMDQARLKREAEVKATGRKARETVQHVTLSWSPEESEDLTREEMVSAADGVLGALGAQDHQVLIVAHTDSEHRHIHLVINRVSPIDGRILPSSKERLKVSEWALEYEKSRGEVLCKQRELNAAARDRGHYTRGQRSKPRHIFELEAANSNLPDADKIQAAEKEKDRALRRRDAEQKKRHAREWSDLEALHKEQRESTRRDEKAALAKAAEDARSAFSEERSELACRQEQETQQFEAREGSLVGKAANAFRSVDWKALFRKEACVTELKSAVSKDGRLETLARTHAQESRRLRSLERRLVELKTAEVRTIHAQQRSEHRTRATLDRASLRLTQSVETAAMKKLWAERRRDRAKAWDVAREQANAAAQKQQEAAGAEALQTRKEQSERARAHMVNMREAWAAKSAADQDRPLTAGETFQREARKLAERSERSRQDRDSGLEL